MSSSLDYFNRGLSRAFARRKEQHSKQPVQKINNDVIESNAQERKAKQQTNVDSNRTSHTASLTDEQYQATIIERMIAHIKQKKESV
ncbi:hypothetical protein EI534_07350 [Pseudomonas frederiksbergensis]|nr:hypothetical protein [Pseudomonas frederiksbergensis]